MFARLVIFLSVLLLGFVGTQAQEVVRVSWQTKFASTPPALTPPASDLLPVFRLALNVFSESNIVALALGQPAFLGLPAQDAARLQQLTLERYQVIQNDPVFRVVDSVLPYCYAEQKPTNGLALVYCPKHPDTNTVCMVFLHGYGGSFLWSQQLLAEAFPDRIIICPAFGISSALMPPTYLSECLAATGRKLGFEISRPILIGLSAGGFGATRIFVQSTNEFKRLVVLAAYPPAETLARFTKPMSACFLVGEREFYVQSGAFNTCIRTLQQRGVKLKFRALPEADHFFLLAQKEATLEILHTWLDKPETE